MVMEKEQLPLILKATDVARIMGVAKSTAYEMMRMNDFPAIIINSVVRVPRDDFFNWLETKKKGA